MTPQDELEAALTGWLQEEPVGRVRPAVVRAAFVEADTLPQRRAPRTLAWPGAARLGRPVSIAVGGVALVAVIAAGLQLRPVDRAVAPPIASATPFPLAASLVPDAGRAPAEITLGTGRRDGIVTGLSTTFRTDQAIEGTVWRAVPFDFSNVALRWFRLGGPVPVFVGGDNVEGDRAATMAEFSLPPQGLGRYRLVAYRSMTEPMASVDFEIVAGQPVTVPPVAPPLPDGWSVIQNGTRDLRMALPPDIQVGDASGPVYANQAPGPDGVIALQVLAEGPRTAWPQPGSSASLVDWMLQNRFAGSPLLSTPVARAVRLPAGDAVELRVLVAAEVDRPRLVVMLAIRSPEGVGTIMIDGPQDVVTLHATDLDLIPRLVEFPPDGG